jgi:uncharacterized protein (DUF2267 family)
VDQVSLLLRSITTAIADLISMGEPEVFQRQLPRCIRQFFQPSLLRPTG